VQYENIGIWGAFWLHSVQLMATDVHSVSEGDGAMSCGSAKAWLSGETWKMWQDKHEVHDLEGMPYASQVRLGMASGQQLASAQARSTHVHVYVSSCSMKHATMFRESVSTLPSLFVLAGLGNWRRDQQVQ